MEENIVITPAKKRKSLWMVLSKMPWPLLIVAYLGVAYWTKIDLVANKAAGYGLIAVGLFVIFVEFFKSADIGTISFLLNLVFSVIAIILGTVLMTKIVLAGQWPPSFHYWYGAAILLADVILGPYNSFRTATRNFQVGDGN